MSVGDEKVSALASAIEALLATGNSSSAVIDKLAAALHQAGLPKEADLVHNAASALWGEPSDVDQIVAFFEAQAFEERELLDSGRCNNPPLAQERWMLYTASAQAIRERAWQKAITLDSVTWAQLWQVAEMDLSQEDIGDFATARELVRYAVGGHRAAKQRCVELLNTSRRSERTPA